MCLYIKMKLHSFITRICGRDHSIQCQYCGNVIQPNEIIRRDIYSHVYHSKCGMIIRNNVIKHLKTHILLYEVVLEYPCILKFVYPYLLGYTNLELPQYIPFPSEDDIHALKINRNIRCYYCNLLFTRKTYIRKAITRNGIHFVCNKCGLRNYRVIERGRAHENILRYVLETYPYITQYIRPDVINKITRL